MRVLDLLHEDILSPETVIGEDTRQQVLNTTDHPFRTVGLISMDGGSCTGTLIGPHHVLTAGHCVYNIETDQWYQNLDFTPGQEGYNRPYGTVGVSGARRLGETPSARFRHRDAHPQSGNRRAGRLDGVSPP